MRVRDALTWMAGVGSMMLAGTACGASGLPDGALALNERQAEYDLQVLIDGQPAPTFQFAGETYVLGHLGERYTLRVRNHSPRRIEAVVSVDGRDAIDGKTADFRGKRGYLVPAWGQVEIDGWRLSRWQAAAFRFSTVEDSYAARSGAARNVGVIGAAIFTERYLPPPPPPPVYEVPQSRSDYDGRNRGAADEMGSAGSSRGKAAPTESAPSPAAAPPPASPRDSASASAEPAPPASPSAGAPYSPPTKKSRSGLGTEFGEAVASTIHEVSFVRANPNRPSVILGVRYNDRDGLVALGIDVDRLMCPSYGGCDQEVAVRRTARPFPVSDRRFAAPPAGWSPGCCR